MTGLDQAVGIIEHAKTEHADLRHQFDQQRVELQQTRNRLQREQDRSRALEEQVADLQLQIEQVEANRAHAVAATLAHTSRTT